MTPSALKVPGVYRQEVVARRAPVLATGVPVFVGFVATDAAAPAGAPSDDKSYGPVVLRRKADFPGGALGFLRAAIDGFFDNEGPYCYVVGVRLAPTDAGASAALIAAIATTRTLADVDLVVVPDAMALTAGAKLDEPAVLNVQRELISHCETVGNRVALLDALPNKDANALITDQLQKLGVGTRPINAALYHPWIRAIDGKPVPPSGHIAGIIARTDAVAGVFKAPANVEIQGATDVSAELDFEALGDLNDAGVNCLRALPGRGIRVSGARTLSSDPSWRYLNVRRLVLTLLRWIELNMAWVTFESNAPALWSRIQRELGAYLTRLWRAGGLQGDSIEEAFFVRCDADLNPPDKREAGHVITEIGLAPSAPAEFILVSVQHRAGTTELT